ncbi:hypothetical protein Q664_05230 [Archangium violaceum Cb vi76]|uniref:Xylose isomerase-like TIM barrel domain-containing protein n=1 Tax=Archangium violaceum Cb vi76 TaxID=1406225 RepID=A0A084T009_9BACT|nr:hypothetical protein Q664_05230 [Archangium violaceum Cb vi76]
MIDYVEVNYPLMPGGSPDVSPTAPILVHCPINPIASVHGFNRALARQVRAAAIEHGSPWIGEHLCWAGPGPEGRLGYIVNPLFCDAVRDAAIENARALTAFYGRPIALELAPVYDSTGTFDSEVHFLASVARAADTHVIFDLAHWTASNRNLRRPADFGLDVLEPERIVELHLAGIRSGRSGRFWHDSHGDVPEEELLELTAHLARRLPRLAAVTFEHAEDAPEADFMRTLERLRRVLG